jgi:hypothetical protein
VHLDSTGWAVAAVAFSAILLLTGALATGALNPDQETTP